MDGPWNDYQPAPAAAAAPAAGPWSDYAPAAAAPAPAPSVGADVAKSGGVGLVRGALDTLGMIPDLGHMMKTGFNAVADKVLGPVPEASQSAPDLSNYVGGAALNKEAQAAAPALGYQPQTTAGKYAETAGEFIPGAMLAPGDAPLNALRYGVIPGLTSEAAGQATAGTAAEPWARAAGGVLGGLAGPGLTNLPGKLISPNTITPERQALVDALQTEGVPLTAGQQTGSKPLRWGESALSDLPFAGGGAADIQAAQGRAFTGAALKRAGIDGDLADPETLSAGNAALGQQYQDLASRNTLVPDAQFTNDVQGALDQYHSLVPESARAPGVGGIVSDLLKPAESSQLSDVGHYEPAPLPGENAPGAPPQKPSTQTIQQFIVSKLGGIRDDDGDLASMGMQKLIRPNGMSPDRARSALAEAGYLGGDTETAMRESLISDMHDAISANPISVFDQNDLDAYQSARSRYDAAKQGQVEAKAANAAIPRRAPGKTADLGLPANMEMTAKPLAGDQYQALRSRLSKQAQSLRMSDPPQAHAYRGIRDALDSAMERSIAQNNPADSGAWKLANRQYGNLKDISKAAGAAGENAAQGVISPAQLRTAIASGKNKEAYARGQGDLAGLTRAGNAVMLPLPNSGTTPRAHINHLLDLAGGIGGALAGGPVGALGGLAAAIAGPAVGGRVLMSKPVQHYLANQLAQRKGLISPAKPGAARLAAALNAHSGLLSGPAQSSP